MMMTMLIPIAFVIIGALGYSLSANPKIQELSRLLFFSGTLALAIALSGKTLSV